MAWQHISPEMTVMGFKKCCISTAMGEADEVMLVNDSKEEWVLREMKALTVTMETVTLTGKVDRIWQAVCFKCMKLTVKYFFLEDILFLLGVILGVDKYIFPLHACFIWVVIFD